MLLMLVEIKHPGGCVRFFISQTGNFDVLGMCFLSHLDDLCVGLDNFVIKMSNMSFVSARSFLVFSFRAFAGVYLAVWN